jgi:hypothetical protein
MAGEKKFAKLGAKLADLEEANSDRLKDAEALINGGCHASAIAMGLYALEITLKIAICRRLDIAALPVEFQVHDFEGLLVLSGLSNRLNAVDFAEIKKNWDFLVGEYGPAQVSNLRYARGSFSDDQSKDVLRRLRDPVEGVLPWVLAQT